MITPDTILTIASRAAARVYLRWPEVIPWDDWDWEDARQAFDMYTMMVYTITTVFMTWLLEGTHHAHLANARGVFLCVLLL